MLFLSTIYREKCLLVSPWRGLQLPELVIHKENTYLRHQEEGRERTSCFLPFLSPGVLLVPA